MKMEGFRSVFSSRLMKRKYIFKLIFDLIFSAYSSPFGLMQYYGLPKLFFEKSVRVSTGFLLPTALRVCETLALLLTTSQIFESSYSYCHIDFCTFDPISCQSISNNNILLNVDIDFDQSRKTLHVLTGVI